MGSDFVVMGHPLLDHHLGFEPVAEPFHREAFIPESAIEALCGPVLPGFAGFDQGGFDLVVSGPFEQGRCYEFRPVVASQVGGRTALADQSAQYFDHLGRADRAGHLNGQCLLGELVDHRQALQLLSVRACVEHEIV